MPCPKNAKGMRTSLGLPPGRARLRKWRPSHALEATGAALTRPWRGMWRAGAVPVSGPDPSRT